MEENIPLSDIDEEDHESEKTLYVHDVKTKEKERNEKNSKRMELEQTICMSLKFTEQ